MHEEVKLLLEGEIKRLRNLLEVHLRQHSVQLVPAIDDKKKKKKSTILNIGKTAKICVIRLSQYVRVV